jgi:precorrin-6A synthase
MRKILVIGIGAGNPDYMTIQAINALNAADVFFVLDKGEAAEELIAIREEICRRFITRANYRVVKVPQPERDRASANYKAGVDAWHADKAALFETLIGQELAENECGAFLVWGDPALYDSTIRILHRILARGQTAFDYEVIPGITSAQALAAGHKIPLNRIGEPVELTTGRRIANGFDRDSVVLLDAGSGLNALRDQDATIYWGAYLGTPDEVLITGKLKDVGGEILRVREAMRRNKGWIMDTYLLRRDEDGS